LRTRLLVLCLVAFPFLPVKAGATTPPGPDRGPHAIPRIDGDITIDGVLDEPAWRSAWVVEMAYEVHPGENTPAPVRTEVLVMHDRTRLYVGFRAHDPEPSAIRAHLSDRDDAWNDDWVGVVLDTFNDERRNYLLVVNPLGVQMDTIETRDDTTVWDGIWDSGGRITEWGWSAEIEVPFSTLRFQPSDRPQVWGFDAIRGYPRNMDRQMGTFPRDRSNNCYLCQAIKIEGFEEASPGRNLEVVPTLTAARTAERSGFPDGPFETDDSFEAGITARWGVTPNLTLSGTINPDFSQVEADARQLDINQPFALFFPEKRPFFMEAADFFGTLMDAVYTRTVRDPAWGLKLTGKLNGHTVASYVVQDDVTNLIIPGSQGSAATSLDASNLAAVARYRYDLGDSYTLGALVTLRDGEHGYFNQVAGADAELRLTPRDRIMAQVLASSSRYPQQVAEDFDQPRGTFDDWFGELLYSHGTRTWSWWAQTLRVGDGFRADSGFMPRVDYRHSELGAGYTWNPTPDSWYSRIDIKAKAALTEQLDGTLLLREDAVHFTVEGPLQSHSYLRPSREREGFGGQEFDLFKLRAHTCLKPNAHSHVWINLRVGDQVDYANVQSGDVLHLNPGFWYRFGRHLRVELSHIFERMEVEAGELYEANITQSTVSWQFNPRTFVRAILQHVDYQYDPERYADGRDPEFRHLFSQLLFSYKLNPRTVFFLGYSDNAFADHTHDLTRADWTVFAKVGYAWVL
jgi:hypothetical protein